MSSSTRTPRCGLLRTGPSAFTMSAYICWSSSPASSLWLIDLATNFAGHSSSGTSCWPLLALSEQLAQCQSSCTSSATMESTTQSASPGLAILFSFIHPFRHRVLLCLSFIRCSPLPYLGETQADCHYYRPWINVTERESSHLSSPFTLLCSVSS